MAAVKVTFAGGGSLSFTPGQVYQFVREPALAGTTLCLYDPDLEAARLMERLARRAIAEAGADLKVEVVGNRDEALSGAAMVICPIAVGGMEAFRADVEIPLRYGLVHSVGDSVGPAGIFRALRMVPAFLDLARAMERCCPQAWLVNFSNPMTPICRAVARETAIRVVGLCHGYQNTLWELAEVLGVPPEETEVRVIGVNHLIFFTHLSHQGRDLLPALREKMLASPEYRGHVTNALYRLYGYYLGNGDRHISEFFPCFFSDRSAGGARYRLTPNSIDSRIQSRRARIEKLKAMAAGERPLDIFGNERAVDILLAHLGVRPARFVANLTNGTFRPDLPPYTLVEANVGMEGDDLHFLPGDPLPPGLVCLLTQRAASQELVTQAAVTGDRDLILQALASDPMSSSLTLEEIERMMEERLKIT